VDFAPEAVTASVASSNSFRGRSFNKSRTCRGGTSETPWKAGGNGEVSGWGQNWDHLPDNYKRIQKKDRFYTDIQFDVIDFSITISESNTVCFL